MMVRALLPVHKLIILEEYLLFVFITLCHQLVYILYKNWHVNKVLAYSLFYRIFVYIITFLVNIAGDEKKYTFYCILVYLANGKV